MAETPVPTLEFLGGCPDCGQRKVTLPRMLPHLGDDFDWWVRDFDGFRRFMLEELVARFPERSRWTPADMEVVIIEVLATVLDQLSDMTDRVATEATLETARQPRSVRRLLGMIGYSATDVARARGEIPSTDGADAAASDRLIEDFWLRRPSAMDRARREGPQALRTQHRMVTPEDYAQRLEDHPLVRRTHAWVSWTGSWSTVRIAVIAWNDRFLDEPDSAGKVFPEELRKKVEVFHKERALPVPVWAAKPTIRTILRPYLDAYRMAGQEAVMEDAVPVGLQLAVSVIVATTYFQSEVRDAVHHALGTDAGGFFEPGRLYFGEDVHASDLIQELMALDGVEYVCFNRFKRIGDQYPDQSATGRIELTGLEVAVCDNAPAHPERGYYRLTLHGGLTG